MEKLASEWRAEGVNPSSPDAHLRPHLDEIFVALIGLESLPPPYKSLMEYLLICYRDVSLEMKRQAVPFPPPLLSLSLR